MSFENSKRRSWNPAAFSSFKSDLGSCSPPQTSSSESSICSDSSLLSPSTSPPQSRPSSFLVDCAVYSRDDPVPTLPTCHPMTTNDLSTTNLLSQSNCSTPKSIPLESTPSSNRPTSFPQNRTIPLDIDPNKHHSSNTNNAHSSTKSIKSRSLHISPAPSIPPSKRWSSSALLENNHPRLINQTLSSSHLASSKWMLPEQESALQFKLQQLARTENARLKAHEEIFSSTTSPIVKTPSSDSFVQSHSTIPFPVISSLLSPSYNRHDPSSHQRNLSLQPYYNSTNTPPELFPQDLANRSSSAHRHSSSTPTTTHGIPTIFRPMSPRAMARAATLAALNSEPDQHVHSLQNYPNTNRNPSISNSHHHHRPSSTYSLFNLQQKNRHSNPEPRSHGTFPFSIRPGSLTANSSAPSPSTSDFPSDSSLPVSATASTAPTPPYLCYDSEVSIPLLLRSKSLSNRRGKPVLQPLDIGDSVTSTQPLQAQMADKPNPFPAGITVPEGYYIISAAELEKLGAKVDKDNNILVDNDPTDIPTHNKEEHTESSAQPKTGVDFQHAVKSVQKSGDIMNEWVSTYKSPAAIFDIFSLFWAMLTTNDGVIESKQGSEEDKEDKEEEEDSLLVSISDEYKQVYRDFKLANFRGVLRNMGMMRHGLVSMLGTGCVMSVIFVQVSLLSIMVLAYVLGDILTMPIKKGVVFATDCYYRKVTRQEEQKKLAKKKQREEKFHSNTKKHQANTESGKTGVSSSTNHDDTQQSVPTTHSSTSSACTSPTTTEPTLGTANIKLKPVKKGKKSVEYIDPSVLLSNALKAKRAALKQAKRRSKH